MHCRHASPSRSRVRHVLCGRAGGVPRTGGWQQRGDTRWNSVFQQACHRPSEAALAARQLTVGFCGEGAIVGNRSGQSLAAKGGTGPPVPEGLCQGAASTGGGAAGKPPLGQSLSGVTSGGGEE